MASSNSCLQEVERRCNTAVKQTQSGPPDVYKVKISAREYVNKSHKIRKCKIGSHSEIGVPREKVVLVVGATGAGKSTLINSMVNYIYGVEFKEDIRFKLVGEEKGKSQAQSQTSVITSYTIHHHDSFKIPYTLTIIDTPGIADTQGIERDAEIMDDIKEFFMSKSGIDHIDAVCFVTQASLARLTTNQRYVFDSIMSLFGKDIKENIMMMLTFADGQTPNVLEALAAADLPTEKNRYFKFNNSSLYTSYARKSTEEKENNDAEDEKEENKMFDAMFWNMNKSSFARFFTELEYMPSKSLQLTKDVLKEREQLEIALDTIQAEVKYGLSKIKDLETELKVLEKYEKEIEKNKNFIYETETTEKLKVPVRKFKAVNCDSCEMTCHDGCQVITGILKWTCNVFKNGKCQACFCGESDHKISKMRYISETKKIKKTYEDLKKKYESAQHEYMTKEKLVAHINEEIENIQQHVFDQAHIIRKSLERLREIALRPNPLSVIEYFNLIIQKEREDCKSGYAQRVETLTRTIKRMEELEKFKEKDYDPWQRIIHFKEKMKIGKRFKGQLNKLMGGKNNGDSEVFSTHL